MLHCSPEASAEFDSVSKLSMLEVLKQRKRRRRLTFVNRPEEENQRGIDVTFSSDTRNERKLQTREPLLQIDASFDVDHGAVGVSKRKRRTINPSISRSVSWRLIFATTSLALLLGSMIDTADAFQPSRRQTRCSPLPSSFPLPMSLATPTSSSLEATIPSKTELESMKVTDLKQLIKDSGLNERGLLSKLKKKQDLVEFLAEKSQSTVLPQPAAAAATTTETEEISKAKQQQVPKQPKKVPLTMPKKKPATATPAAASDNPQQQQRQSPMQDLFDQVNEQYPALQYLRDGNSTLFGELDIRQRYHPLLQAGNLQAIPESELSEEQEDDDSDEGEPKLRKKGFKPALSGDMDLIFVGTASCTPSITRGVSCTALRLHSLASSASTSKKASHQQPNYNGKNSQRFDVEKGQPTNLGTWLFDCGESTQLQIQKTSSVRPSKITKIFLSHAHGDHSFGLPGLLCLMGQDTAGGNEAGERGPNGENIRKTKDSKPPIDIYGPEGLRLWLRTAIRYSVSRIVPRYRVHELKDVAMGPEWGYSPKWEKYYFNKQTYFDLKRGNINGDDSEFYWGAANRKRQQALRNPRRRGQTSDWVSLCEQGAPGIERSELYGEVEGGRDIYPMYDHPLCSDGAPIWEVEHEGGDETDPQTGEPLSGIKVYAGPMSHGVPCVGYVVQEAKRPGRLRSELVTPICQRNVPALKEAGFRHPMKALAVIKELPEGGSFTFPDGTVVTQEEAVEPSRPGRKVVICGDTNSARSLENLAKDADVVVHESTNTFLPFFEHRDANPQSVLKEAIFHGHSTPQIAGDFAKRVGAKRLILNHFSARYMGDQSLESMSIMTRIEQQAMKASGLSRSNVAAAWDFMIFPIPKAYQKPETDETKA